MTSPRMYYDREKRMGNIFSASEVVQIGIQIEKNGRDFYEVLKGKSSMEKVREVFSFLSGEEERHIKVFEGILGKAEGYVPPESYPGELLNYINALAAEYIFTQEGKGKLIASAVKNDKEATGIAIGFEKDSIIFYEGMKGMVASYEAKVVNELIQQEQAHLVKLTELEKLL